MRSSELSGERIGVCMSGGLSCLAMSRWLKEQGLDTLNFVADIGQVDQEDAASLVAALNARGMPSVAVDLRDDMAEMCFALVKYQATYDNGYWNTTSASRAVLVKGLSQAMRERGCTVLAHGAVGGGNDQARFDRYTRQLAPDLKVFAPWMSPALLERFPSRASMVELLQAAGLRSGAEELARHSTDANLAGISHEDAALENLETPCTFVRPLLSVWPHEAPDAVEVFRVRFEEGRAVALDDEPVTPLECMRRANLIAGRNGLWMRTGLENRINGTKCRGVYEAPGLELLGYCLRQLYQATLEKQACRLLETLSSLIGRHVYEGRYFDTSTQAARAAMDVLAQSASGKVEVGLYKGNIYLHRLTDFPSSPDTARQTRFSGGGHRWQGGPGGA